MRGVCDGYPTLFGAGDETGEDTQADTEADAAADKDEGAGFASKWGWVANIDAVAETARCSWEDATALPVREFLNTLCYRNDKINEQERQRREYLRKH